MATYEFEPNAMFHNSDKADPDTVGTALDDIANKHGGRLKPDDVVEEARKPRHPLHKHFEWDDNAAAEAYRINQARAIIRSVRIVATDINEGTARAYHSINDDGRAYRSVSEIQTSAMLQLSLHRAALRDLMAWENRYRSIAGICNLVSVARERLEQQIETIIPAAATRRRRRGGGDEERPSA